MKKKLVLGVAGALTLSFGFTKDSQSTKVFAQTEQSKVKIGQTATNNGDQYRIVSREEQDRLEGMIAEGKDHYTFISAEEQNMVENSSAQQGFVPHENGTGFYFVRVK